MSGHTRVKATILVAVTTLIASGLALGSGSVAQAVNIGAITTHMEIDASPNANKVTDVAGNFDWNDILDGSLPGGYVGSGFTSAGIVDASFVVDSPDGTIANACTSTDATAAPGSQTIHTNPWVVGPVANPTKKGDLCTGAAALEIANVNGDLHYILYQYWTRDPSSTGDLSLFQILEGPAAGRCDDRLLESNYDPAGSPNTTFAAYSWLPAAGNCIDPLGSGTWTPSGITGVQTTGANPDKGVAANSDTFGESALDLTLNGIIPADKCVTYTSSGFLSRTGNPQNNTSQNVDYLAFNDPIVVNNCSSVSVSKVTQPAGFATSDSFTYKLDQLDGKATHDASLLPAADGDGSFASITDTIQSGQTDTWSNVIAQPDFRLAETVVPANWSLQQLSCTFWDPFFVVNGSLVPQLRTVTSATSPLSPFVVPPAILKPAGQPNTSCTITNNTSGIRVAKTGAGAPGTQFSFARTGGPTFPLTLNGAPADFVYAPGTSVTLSETSPAGSPAWTLTSIACTRLSDGGAVTPTSVNLAGKTVTVSTIAGDVVSCSFNNVQQGRIVVQKATSGGTGTFNFTGAVAGAITTTTSDDVPSGTPLGADVAPGTYSVAESAAPGWSTTSTCSDGSPVTAIAVAAGETVTCTFHNTKLAQIVVAKHTTPAGSAVPFGFEGSWNGPSDGTADFSVTDGATVASPLLQPGTYTVSELASAGWDLTALSCARTTNGAGTSSAVTNLGTGTATITLAAGDVVTCSYANTQRGTIVIVKNSAGGDATFGFTGSWAGAGSFGITTTAHTGQQTFQNVAPGAYTVSETDPTAAFDLTNVQCVDTDGGSAPSTPTHATTGSIDVDPGETVTCTFNNTKKGTIVIVKDAQPNLADDFAFTSALGSFTLDDDLDATLGNTQTFTNVQSTDVAGTTYSVAEAAAPGWTLDSIDCSNNSAVNLSTRSVAVAVGAGETVQCTFTNVAVPATVTIDKTVSGVAAGFPWSFAFSLSPLPSGQTSPKTISGTGPTTGSTSWADLVPGTTYTVAEQLVPGWTQTLTCAGVTDTDGIVDDSVTFVATPGLVLGCAAANVAAPATIEVVKTSVGDTGTFRFAVTPADVTGLTADTALANPATTGVKSGLIAGQSYTVAENDPGTSWIAGALSCTLDPAGAAPAATIPTTFVPGPGGAVRCEITNTKKATVVITKSTIGGDGSFAFTGDFPGTIVTNNNTGNITSVDVAPGTYTETETDPTPSWDLTSLVCNDSNSSGSVAARTATIVADPGELVRCTFTNTKRGAVTVVKTVTTEPTLVAGNTYVVEYDLVVTSQSFVPETFDLADTLHFGAGTSNISATATGPAGVTLEAGWNGLDSTLLANDAIIPARTQAAAATLTFTVTVTFDVAGSMAADARDCQTVDGEGTGTLNSASVTSRSGVSDSSDCGVIPAPQLSIEKLVLDGPSVGADGTWTIMYSVVVSNDGDGPGHYVLNDTPQFGAGVTVTSATVTAVTPGLTTNAAFDGAGDPLIAEADIAAGSAHEYQVTVTATIAPSVEVLGSGDCALTEGENGTGFLNVATLLSEGSSLESTACAEFSRLTLRKVVTNDDGGNAVAADFDLSASLDDAVVLSGAGLAQGAVLANRYDLAEASVAGYTASAWDCGDAAVVDGAVFVDAGADVECVITNDDQPVDLQLDKTDNGASLVAGGAPITYTITVSNVGTRSVDAAEPVVVTDVLPSASLSWVPGSVVGCSSPVIDGLTLTCTIPGSSLDPGDAPVVITASVVLDSGAAPAVFTNTAFVTTQDDPACLGDACVPPCPGSAAADSVGALAANNVDCEDTPSAGTADLQIVKTVSNSNPDVGTSFTWILDVTNLGPSTANDVIVSDSVPGPLQVTAASSNDFSCAVTGNAVRCTRPSLANGASGRITITVTLPATSVVTSITNVGDVSASTPDPDLSNNSDPETVLPRLVSSAAPVPPAPVVLPRTGSDVLDMIVLATMIFGLGIAISTVARRRRAASLPR